MDPVRTRVAISTAHPSDNRQTTFDGSAILLTNDMRFSVPRRGIRPRVIVADIAVRLDHQGQRSLFSRLIHEVAR